MPLQQTVSALPPKVSVILPSYNHAAFVIQAVESVLSQSFSDLELIITDDGSTDQTAAKIRSVADPRIRCETLPTNHGYSSALNACLARARGELVALHCSDDIFLPGKLERQVTFLDANPGVAAVFGKPSFVDKDGRSCPRHGHPFDDLFIDGLADRFAWLRLFLLRGNALCHPTALVRRAIYHEVGGYDPLLVQLQDYDFWVRVCGKHEIKVLDEPLISYRVLGEGLNTSWPSAETTRRAAWETRRVLRRFLAFDPTLIRRAFGADLAELGLAPDLPPRTALGLLLAARGEGAPRQAFALELLEEAVAEGGNAGVDRTTFSRLAGALDPFNLSLVQAAASAQQTAELRAVAAEARATASEQRAAAADALAGAVMTSTFWRATAPLRRLIDSRTALRSAVRWALGTAPRPVVTSSPSTAAVGVSEQLALPALPPTAEPASLVPVPALQPLPEWEHVPEGWRSDDPRGKGWEHPSVVEAQQCKWPTFIEAVQSTKPLGVYHEAAHISSENPAAHNFVLAFAYVLARAAVGSGSLSVLDWGGGLGQYAVIARNTLPEVCIEYTVFDLPGVCAAGRELLSDVRFSSDAEACLAQRYDLIFASGSLQYAADWCDLLARFATSAKRWVFLSRTPFVDASPSFVVVQRPHSAGGYHTEYLSRVFNRPELLAEAAAAGLDLEREFMMVGERVAAAGAPAPFEYRGFLLRPAGLRQGNISAPGA